MSAELLMVSVLALALLGLSLGQNRPKAKRVPVLVENKNQRKARR